MKNNLEGRACSSVVECLPNTYEALGLISRLRGKTKQDKKRRKRKRKREPAVMLYNYDLSNLAAEEASSAQDPGQPHDTVSSRHLSYRVEPFPQKNSNKKGMSHLYSQHSGNRQNSEF